MFSEKTLQEFNIEIIIENVVATAKIGNNLDVEKIAKKFSNTKYNRKKFPGAIIQLRSPRTTILLFRTGSVVCTGTKSEEKAKNALYSFTNQLEEFGIDLGHGLSDIKIENIVSSCNLGSQVHLEKAARVLPRSMYEPEQFPGIIHRLHYPKTVILLFASGKLVCTGAKITNDIDLSVHTFRAMLNEKDLIKF